MNLLDLPDCVLMDIFEYLSYDEASKKRLVCRRIDHICQQVLNAGFNRVMRQHSIIFKRIKAQLPRRESERRNHCLARHADILTSVETRISMLSMTYSKYMEMNLCCFIPGRVLDELFHVLRLVSKTRITLRPHEVLQELRDISSMAMEHFDEKMANLLKAQMTTSSSRPSRASSSLSGIGFSVASCWGARTSAATNSGLGAGTSSGSSCSSHYCEAIRHRLDTLINIKHTSVGLLEMNRKGSGTGQQQQCDGVTSGGSGYHNDCKDGCPEAKAIMTNLKKLETEYKKGIVKINRLQQIQTHQTRRLQQTLTAVGEMNTQIIELKRRLEDIDAKNREISANIKQINPGEAAPATATVTSPSIVLNESEEAAKTAESSETTAASTHTMACKSTISPTTMTMRKRSASPDPEAEMAKKSKVVLPD